MHGGYIGTMEAISNGANKSINKNLRLYTAVGELESLYNEYTKMTAFLKEKNFPGLVFNSGVVKHSGHSGVKAEGVTRGMQFIFKKPVIVLTRETLQKYAGTYKQKDGEEELNFSVNGDTLELNHTDSSTPLSAQTNVKFYHTGEFLEFEFQVSGEEVTVLRETFNGEMKFVKINVDK